MSDTVALLPADGWRAVYAREDITESEDETAALSFVPLIAFALIMDLDGEEVVGMVPDGNVVIPCVSPTFIGYLARDAHPRSMLPNLEEWRAVQRELAEREELVEEIRGEQLKSTSEKFSETGATGPN